ncbi:2-C-methyl-D-erythritol 4-phosphate cytidylyltransferase [Marivita sp. GX14005]|uniref:2-C-methyl-D-erythritol 4-phosphate cytidylyltransferase n=1 Tax=Marivita sp. GX14005 TaxID=2942276 RepID=UPI002018AE3C|nr:2-C-methyl-D-erythritol 4-phosphate cytidylyltransferase [Marivita sp. GX14005]MCL3883104.1 2-C-methyl-D-erythritol 4-phosphate cytidylyltransferase [Marivita sp. GX14005]
MTTAALIVAAGRGRRMGMDRPKQFTALAGIPVLRRTIDALLLAREIDLLRVVIHPDDHALYNEAAAGQSDARLLPPVIGGETRSASVRRGLEALADDAPEIVLIHDAARPFCSVDLIARVLESARHTGGAFAALPVVDALWQITDGSAARPVERAGLWRAQTPQAFRFDAIRQAHQGAETDAADDVEIARRAGLSVRVVEGDEQNFKITLPQDLSRAEWMIKHGGTNGFIS